MRVPDIEAIEDAIRGVPLQAARLTAQSGWVKLMRLDLPGLSLTVGSFDFPLMTFGEVLPQTVTIVIPLSMGEGSWNGVELDDRSLWSYAPGSEHEGVASWAPRFAAITMPADERLGCQTNETVVVRSGDEVARLGTLLRTVAHGIQAQTVIPDSMPSLEKDIREALTEAVQGPAPEQPRLSASARIVRSCIEAADRLGPNPQVATMAETLGVSDRWIRAAFRKEYGLPPSEFFQIRNLHHARRDLCLGTRHDTTVAEVATKWGFWHLGRFSGTYQQRFGEYPAQTLRSDPR